MHTDDQMTWKTLSSKYLYRDDWFVARVDSCERPDGKIVEPYYVLEYTNWVTGLGITENNEAVLVKQYRHALQQVCLETPGGCVDKTDNHFDEAIQREMLEETGYAFSKTTFLGTTSPNPSTNSNLMYMYLLEGGKKIQEQQLDANEHIDVMLVPLAELKDLLLQNKLVQSMHVTTIFYALLHLGKLKIDV
jgi:ADP-ribose pyrophosphatase